MWCAPRAVTLEIHFVHIIPWNAVQLLFKCSPKILLRRSDKQTLAVVVHIISIVKKIVTDGQSGIVMSFGA